MRLAHQTTLIYIHTAPLSLANCTDMDQYVHLLLIHILSNKFSLLFTVAVSTSYTTILQSLPLSLKETHKEIVSASFAPLAACDKLSLLRILQNFSTNHANELTKLERSEELRYFRFKFI